MRLTFLVTSPRVAPGLLSWSAWDAIASADEVLASSLSAPLAQAVAAAGHAVGALPAPGAGRLVAAAHEADVVWLASDEEAETLPGALAAEVVAAADSGDVLPTVEVLHGSYDLPGARLLDLVAVMDRLRRECPWDREQSHRSLARYLLEEAYETLEAIDTGALGHLREELGDLLLQVCFHARIAEEHPEERFDIDDVAGGIVAKLVHRHPHVFAGLEVAGVEEVEANWESLKTAEKGRSSALEGVPWALPALALAEKVVGRALRAGVDPRPSGGPPDSGGLPVSEGESAADSLGASLLGLVVEGRAAGVDPEQALRDAVRRLAREVRRAEGLPGEADAPSP